MTGEGALRYEVGLGRRFGWVRWVIAGFSLLSAAQIVFVLVTHRPSRLLVMPVIYLVLGALLLWRWRHPLAVTVDREGVHMPGRRTIPWAEIRAIQRPGPYSSVVVLLLENGKNQMAGLPPRYAQQVAAIGEVPLENVTFRS